MAKSVTELVSSMVEQINNQRPDIDTSAGTVIRDAFVDPNAREFSTAYDEIDTLGLAYSINNADQITEEEMDNLSANFNIFRKSPTYSIGQYTFQASNKPIADIQIGEPGGSGGVTLSTRPDKLGGTVKFITTSTVTLSTTTEINPATGYYEVTAPIICLITGTAGNVSANTITEILQSISGIDGGINKIACSGGTNSETNNSMANRVATKMQGVSIGTVGGYKSLVLTWPGVSDASVVTPNDDEAVRGQFGGSVDIYILGTNLTPYQQTEIYNTGNNEYKLTKKPVQNVVSVTGYKASLPYTFTQNVDYVFVQDTTSVYKGSTRAIESIAFLPTGDKPDNLSNMLIIYSYDKNVEDVQAMLDLPENHLVTADILIKQASQVFVDIGITIYILSGYVKETIKSQVETVLTNLVNDLLIGQSIDQTDIVVDIKNQVPGVESIALPINLKRRGGTQTDKVTATKIEYLRVDSYSLAVEVI